MQLQFDLRVALAKAHHQRYQHVQHEGRGGIDPQASGGLLPAQGHLLLCLFNLGEDSPCLGEEGLTLFRQLQAAGGAAQQGDVELVLQPAEGAADARGGLRQLLGGGGDGAGVDHGGEGLQLVQCGFHS
ncbi:hypothetical protein D9M70_497540 [compost metagenome]